jgi:ligand-binding SRPBCC domain-containing protein
MLFPTLVALLAADESEPAGAVELYREAVVEAPIERAFAFFADAANLQQLTPPWINFRIRSPLPIPMREGVLIDYQISLYGIPFPWRTRIDVWEPGRRFVDRQLAGPYRWWRHEHRFEAAGHHTRIIDVVRYVPRAAMLSRRLVRRDVERIFTYRTVELSRALEVRDHAD